MKIAILLTGLIIEKTKTLSYVKQMFDDFAARNNLQIDYYCHFWSSENLYPYNINYHKTRIVVPCENQDSIDYAINVFEPKKYKISSYTELLPYFKQYYNLNNLESEWVIKNKEYINSNEFNKLLYDRFFLDNYHDPEIMFDYWWYYHTEWCRFAHIFSQAYSTVEILKLMLSTDTHYDACIKWRFDVLADLISNNDKMFSAIEHVSTSDVFYTELAWEGLHWTADLPYNINDATSENVISLHDGWWITNRCVTTEMTQRFMFGYINDMKDIFYGNPVGQHTHFYKAVSSLNIPILLTNRIGCNIIRFTDSIPVDYNNDPRCYYEMLYHANFKAKPQSDYVASLSNWDKRGRYFTIKYFDFY
jgi:hypothetical protein